MRKVQLRKKVNSRNEKKQQTIKSIYIWLCSQIGIHIHEWGNWEQEKIKIKGVQGFTYRYQWRKCKTCGKCQKEYVS